MFNRIRQQNNSASKDGIAVSGNNNNVRQHNAVKIKSSNWRWFIATFIAFISAVVGILTYLK
jgi:hypothetical protein